MALLNVYDARYKHITFAGEDYLVTLHITGKVTVLREVEDHMVLAGLRDASPYEALRRAGYTEEFASVWAPRVQAFLDSGAETFAHHGEHDTTVLYRVEDDTGLYFSMSRLKTSVVMTAALEGGRIVDSTMVSGLREKVAAAARELDAADAVFHRDDFFF
jgi:hypothetical protein